MKLIPTGIKVTEKEVFEVTQSLGRAAYYKEPDMIAQHNDLLKKLGEKYKYDWTKHEIQPLTREVLKRCEDCNEEIPKEDISIKE
jgi:hypothetical protein